MSDDDLQDWYRYRAQSVEPERLRFRPWIGVVISVLVFLAAGRKGDAWMLLRGLAMTGFFTSLAISDRRKRQPNEGVSVWELRNVVFAGFCALLTLGFAVAWIIDHWPR